MFDNKLHEQNKTIHGIICIDMEKEIILWKTYGYYVKMPAIKSNSAKVLFDFIGVRNQFAY